MMTPWRIIVRLYAQRELIEGFTKREIFGRYRGSYFGLLWSFLNPLAMLGVYLFVFGIVYKSRFGYRPDESATDYGLALFCGLNLFNALSEVLTKAPALIVQNPNFVKKVVFPLEIIPVAAAGSALFHCLVAYVPLILLLALFHHTIPLSVLYIPLYLLPLTLLNLGLAWGIAAVGVFVRDLQLFLTSVVMVLLFVSAVFYPLRAVPPSLRSVIAWNPLAGFLDSARRSIIWGISPDWPAYLIFAALSVGAFAIGFGVFERSKQAFPDVI